MRNFHNSTKSLRQTSENAFATFLATLYNELYTGHNLMDGDYSARIDWIVFITDRRDVFLSISFVDLLMFYDNLYIAYKLVLLWATFKINKKLF